MNDLEKYVNIFDSIEPWKGAVPQGFLVDFLGNITDANFRTMWGIDPLTTGGRYQETRLPEVIDGEGWFETVNWILAARDAREKFTMITLGACYGAHAVGCHTALQMINPMPAKLITVEPEPENHQWILKHLRDNGIDPDEHWLLNLVISDSNQVTLFPVGSPGTGVQNCVASNETEARKNYVRQIRRGRKERATVENLILHNSTGISKNLVPETEYVFEGEIKFLSTITLKDLLGPLEMVDYIEADIQQSEIIVFPPNIDLLTKKVRRIHLGTHGGDVHESLSKLFSNAGWEIIFDYRPNDHFSTPYGDFSTNDGVLTVFNPNL